MREYRFRRFGAPRLESLEHRSLLSVTPLPQPEGSPADEAEYAFVDSEAEALVIESDVAVTCETYEDPGEVYACELSLIDAEWDFGSGTVMVVGDDGLVSCWPIYFCQTEPPVFDDWCGTTTTDEISGPSLDGVAIETDWMEPDPGYDIIGLPEGPIDGEVPPDDLTATMPVFDGGGAPVIAEEDLIFYTGGPDELPLVTDSPVALDSSPLAVFLIGQEAAPTFEQPDAPAVSESTPTPAFEQPTDAGPRDGQDDSTPETAQDDAPEPTDLGDDLPATLGLAV